MYHRSRWTPEKIRQRLELIIPLVYIKRKSLPSFRYLELEDALTRPPVEIGTDDFGWQVINANEYWGSWMQNFVLRTTFTIPEDWDKSQPVALYLPLGEAGDFSHPEALVYINGKPFAACDRHHQEIQLKTEWADGRSHLLALHGWTGLGSFGKNEPFTKLYMRQCAVVQIHEPTRKLTSLTRVALETAQNLDEGHPARCGSLPVQRADSGLWVDAGEIAPYSVAGLRKESRAEGQMIEIPPAREPVLENDLLRVEFNSDGDITRIFDKRVSREVLAPNTTANQFQAFEDRPSDWDAWDIEIFYDDKMWLAEPATSIKMIEHGKLRQTIEIKRQIQHSFYTQRISLDTNSPRLDFDTYIDWNERHILLKVAFPVDILAPQATYEIQWGSVQRPTHRNTSWDWARFETCAHKWVDLSEGNYGVSLLNDCKYGHDIHKNVIRITLLRSPTMPDPMADLGEHQFKYSLYPHTGPWNDETQREAYLLNDPIIVYSSKIESRKLEKPIYSLNSLLTVSSPNVIIETVKHAEDGNGIIVRLYESQRQRGPVQVRAGFGVAEAWRANLLEENESQLTVENDSVLLDLKPYQIVTLRLITKNRE